MATSVTSPGIQPARFAGWLLLAAWACILAQPGCDYDHGIDPAVGVPTIRGTLTYKGEPPANTDWVIVVASRDFPPSDVVELALSQSAKLNLSGDSAAYEIEVPALGSYAAIAAVWKARDEPVVWSDILGLYGASLSGGLSFPDTVHVTADAPVVDGVDFTADFGLVDRGAVLSGTITYEGSWPGNTELLGIAAYETRPETVFDFFRPAALNVSLPTGVESYDYKLATPPGTYEYVVVLWKARGTALLAFEELGFHQQQPGSGVPAPVTVALGDTARGIDILVDLGQTK